jgi:hypothetical protein
MEIFLMVSEKSGPMEKQQEFPKNKNYKVLSPLGEETIEDITMAPRHNSLDGKTICLTANGSFKSNVTLKVIEKLLLERYPSVKVIPYTEMPRCFKVPAPGTMTPERSAMEEAFKEKGCDAVISGNGG